MPITAPVSLSKIKAEFQGPNDFKQYYRGGPYVPINSQSTISTTQNGLAISQFLGASKPAPPPPPPPPVQLVKSYIYSECIIPAYYTNNIAQAWVILNKNGTAYVGGTINANDSIINWLSVPVNGQIAYRVIYSMVVSQSLSVNAKLTRLPSLPTDWINFENNFEIITTLSKLNNNANWYTNSFAKVETRLEFRLISNSQSLGFITIETLVSHGQLA